MTPNWKTGSPNPGSLAAQKLGCTCPAMDNARGAGRGDGTFWVTGGCPLHANNGFLEPGEKAFEADPTSRKKPSGKGPKDFSAGFLRNNPEPGD